MMPEGRCPVCGSAALANFLRREGVPVHQHLAMRDPEEARRIDRGTLDLAVCESCGFIFNREFDPAKLRYGASYDNTQECSPFFSGYLDRLVSQLVDVEGVRRNLVVEVGCGKGTFLRKLVRYGNAGNRAIGFDPSYVGPETEMDGRLRFETRPFGPECADLSADVVVCRHVIEHVPDPVALLSAVRKALRETGGPRVYFETPCVEWILRNGVLWDFFYEHCSYFTASSLATALEASGFAVSRVRHVFGGQYLWAEGIASSPKAAPARSPGSVPESAASFARSEETIRAAWGRRIRELSARGKVALWGAGAKGVTLANLVDADGRLLACVVDLNPNKQGRYVAGTGHPIVDYREIARLGVASAVLMNPNYRDENLALLREAHLPVTLVDLTEVADGEL